MKNYNLFTLILLVSVMFTATACKKDKEDPTIIVESPAQHSTYNWGDKVHITANFADDRGLKNYTVMIVDANDEHIHDFDFMKTGNSSELTHEFHDHFEVPNNAPAMAWVHFTVMDANDKSVTKKWMLHFEE